MRSWCARVSVIYGIRGRAAGGAIAECRMFAANVGQFGRRAARAADILWLYVGPLAYRVLVTGRGWTLDEYETWLAGTLYTQLMDNGPPAGKQQRPGRAGCAR